MKIMVFRKTLTLTCKTPVKVTFFIKIWNDPTVITVILTQPVWLETPIEVQFLTKVMSICCSQVWDSFPATYSIIWRSSCGNFDENSIRTRLAWSREHRSWKNHKLIIYSSSFGGRRQRRQPLSKKTSRSNCNKAVLEKVDLDLSMKMRPAGPEKSWYSPRPIGSSTSFCSPGNYLPMILKKFALRYPWPCQ